MLVGKDSRVTLDINSKTGVESQRVGKEWIEVKEGSYYVLNAHGPAGHT